jgi:hypothetical protein
VTPKTPCRNPGSGSAALTPAESRTGGQPRVVFAFALVGGKIAAIEILADPTRLDELDLVILNDGPLTARLL